MNAINGSNDLQGQAKHYCGGEFVNQNGECSSFELEILKACLILI